VSLNQDPQIRGSECTLGLASTCSSPVLHLFTALCVTVGTIRSILEVVLGETPGTHTLTSTAMSVTFYVESGLLFAANLMVVGKLSPVVAWRWASWGTFIGLLPPIFDCVLVGPGSGRYRYFHLGLAEWPLSLYDPRVSSLGESIALWLALISTTVVVSVSGGSFVRASLSFVTGYLSIVVVAAAPPLVTSLLGPRLLGLAGSASSSGDLIALTLQSWLSLGVYFVCFRRSTAKRCFARLPHFLPFLALAFLGIGARKAEGQLGASLVGLVIVCLVFGWLLLAMMDCAIANDVLDGKRGFNRGISTDDRFLSSVVTVSLILGVFDVWGMVGALLCAIQVLAHVYNSPDIRGKSNPFAAASVEAGWASLCFCVGYYFHPRLGGQMSSTAIVVAALVFTTWGLFSPLKDYKDLVFDDTVGNRTLYSAMQQRGVPPQTVQAALVVLMAFAITASAGLGSLLLDVNGLEVGALVVCGLTTVSTLCRKVNEKQFKAFLLSVTCYVLTFAEVFGNFAG
jgi:hypothetical protein